MVISMGKLVYGVGINDTEYVKYKRVNGNTVRCEFYYCWVSMLKRCYSSSFQLKRPSYFGCSVCNDWLSFRNFKAWMEKQDWQGKRLDKDILCVGNKIYSPETCAFVDITTNNFTTDRKSGRGNWPLGVDLHSASTKFRAQCSNRILGYSEHLGYFDCPNKAHLAWKRRKHELACQLADLQSDSRVAAALRIRYL